MTYRAGVIGTGDPTQEDGYAMAYRHARGYERIDDCEVVACADIVSENATAFAQTFDIDTSAVYEDYEEMLTAERLDIVSVCTPPKTHAAIVTDCARSEAVDAIHCEKPMAATWKECRDMVETCDRHGVQLTFNHQRRFSAPYRKAKAVLESGRIGELRRIEVGGPDLFDYGTHLFDLCGYLTDQTPVEWVLAQIDYEDADRLYGVYQESESLAKWRYTSGVDGLASTGDRGLFRCHLRVVGESGAIEIGHEDAPPLRVRDDTSGWEAVETGRDGIWRAQPNPLDRLVDRLPVGPERLFSDPTYVDRAIEDVVIAARDGHEAELSAENALQTTEIIFGGWESARCGGRVELPLEIDDNPLEWMIEDGASSDPSSTRVEPSR